MTVLSEMDFIHSTKESGNKDAEYIFYNGKFSEDEQGEIWIKCFSWTLLEQRTQNISMISKLMSQSRNVFCIILKILFS